jgi:hypothetical protein
VQLQPDAPTYTPYFPHLYAREQLIGLRLRHRCQITDAIEPGLLLGNVIAEFRQGLEGADAHAYRQPRPLAYPLADGLPHVGSGWPQIGQAIQTEKTLIDGIPFHMRAIVPQDHSWRRVV